MEEIAVTLITIGILLLLGLVTDALGRRSRLPRVTLLLLFGFLIGPSGLDFLNPAIDPYEEGDPISSGGHNRDGVWQHLVYDISPYMGNTSANIVYRFYTSDELYNGFKGWFLDNIYVYGY